MCYWSTDPQIASKLHFVFGECKSNFPETGRTLCQNTEIFNTYNEEIGQHLSAALRGCRLQAPSTGAAVSVLLICCQGVLLSGCLEALLATSQGIHGIQSQWNAHLDTVSDTVKWQIRTSYDIFDCLYQL